MPSFARLAALLAVISILYLSGLGAIGLIGPDEPRYAAIGREMASSGDFITPRLWGDPWFEKPALLYWLTALSFLSGVPLDWAPRLPVALTSIAFLALFFRLTRDETNTPTAAAATTILSTSALWLAYSHIAVTDLLLAASFSTAVLCALRYLRTSHTPTLAAAGAALGLAILAKGLVPLVLILPILWFLRHRALALWPAVLSTLAVAAPWYTLCYARNGAAFFNEFILKHHLSRFGAPDLQHVQPWWFYLPVLAAAFFPWSPFLVLLRRPHLPFLRQLLITAAFGLLFFSTARNKLPGYILPLLPLIAVSLGAAITANPPRLRLLFTLSAALLGFVPAILPALPTAIAVGSSKALAAINWTFAPIPVLILAAALYAIHRFYGTPAAAAVLVLTVTACIWRIQTDVYPILDHEVSARGLFRTSPLPPCLDNPHRALHYGLNYYANRAIPLCPDPTPR